MKARAELIVQGIRIIPHDIEATAFRRPLRSERAYDDMSSALHGSGDAPNIGGALFDSGQKVKYRAVVPDVVRTRLQLDSSNVRDEPADVSCGYPQSFPRYVDGGLRYIKNGDVLVSAREEIVDESGFAGADIDDRRGRSPAGPVDQGQGSFKVLTVPADGVRCLCIVDPVPMCLWIHASPICPEQAVC